MKKKLVVGNLKMNLCSLQERELYFEQFKAEASSDLQAKVDVILCVPSVHLETFAKEKIAQIGGQNIYWEERGSFTGETSPKMIKSLGAQYVIIGHSERRKYFHEENEDLNLKIKAALRNNLVPIYCIGETQEQRASGEMAKIINQQILVALKDLEPAQAKQIILAYEPVWAVGSDKIPTSDEILEIKILLKKIISEKFGIETAEKIKILYGGNVKAEFVDQVCLQPQMDGVLVGRESLVPKDFFRIIKSISKL